MSYKAELYWKRKESGLCVKCGEGNDSSGVMCLKCREKDNENKRENYKYYVSIGICPRCHKEKIYGDERLCLSCGADAYKRSLKRDRTLYNDRHREFSKKAYADSVANGICTRCNKRKASEGQKCCKVCIEKRREYRRARRMGMPRKERVENGMCYFCGDSLKEGQRVCAKCHEKITEGNRAQDRSGRKDFKFGKALYDWDSRRKEQAS